MTRDGLSCFLDFQKNWGEDPQTPSARLEKYVLF